MPPLSLISILSTLSIKRFVSYNSSCKRRTRSANCSWLSKASYVYLRPCYDLRTTTEWPRYDTPWTRLQRASLSDLYMFRSSSCIFMFHFMLKLNSFFILMLKNLYFLLVLLYVLSFHNFINMNRFYHLCWFCCFILAKLDEEIHQSGVDIIVLLAHFFFLKKT